MERDQELIREARSLVTGATVHCAGALILAYEVYPPGCPRSRKLEALLRDFVRQQRYFNRMQRLVRVPRRVLDTLHLKSAALNRRLQKFLTSGSD
jgi:hypothetical protein